MPTFDRRSVRKEWMDDLSITDRRLREALHDLRIVNQWLGGYSALWSAVRVYLAGRPGDTVRVLDLGTGIADIPEYLVRRGEPLGCRLEITAVDANPATISYAGEWLDERLEPEQRSRIELVAADAFSLPFDVDSFHLCTASLFLHHLDDQQAIQLVESMDRLAIDGLVVNDLHRTPAAYYGMRFINWLLPVSDMVKHDGPLSVLRGFRREELERIAKTAGCTSYSIEWHWAFRWILSTINV